MSNSDVAISRGPGRVRAYFISKFGLGARESIAGFALIAPFLLFFIVFRVLPYLMSIWLSFVDWHPRGKTDFVGFENYTDVLTMPAFQKSMVNSFYYALMVVPTSIALSLLIAVLITSVRRKGVQSFFQAVYYIPGVVSGLAVAVIWRFIFDGQIGLLNYLTSLVGNPPVKWLGNIRTAMPSLAFMGLLSGNGGSIIIFSAALLGIPSTLYDAASIDGAGFWKRHWTVTIPLLTPALLYVLVLSTLGSLQVFVPIYVMTRGGPVRSTTTVGYYIYNQLMYYGNAGTAAAAGLVLLVATVGLTVFQFRRFSQVIEY